jgi:hypothetical protein
MTHFSSNKSQQSNTVWKNPVRAATDGTNIDLTSSTDPNPVDTVTLADGDRVLLKDQTAGAENGPYIAKTATDPTTWERASDVNEDADVESGLTVKVKEGSANVNKEFTLTTNDPITLGTTSLSFVANAGAGSGGGGAFVNSPYYAISDGDYETIGTYHVSSGSTLEVTELGLYNDLQNVPSGVSIILRDVTGGSDVTSASSKIVSGDPVASVSGQVDLEVRLDNASGSTQALSGFLKFRVSS